MKTIEDIKDFIEERGIEEIALFEKPDFAEAFIGVTLDDRAVYSYEKMVESLMSECNIDRFEATDDIDYNILNSIDHEIGPIVLYFETK